MEVIEEAKRIKYPRGPEEAGREGASVVAPQWNRDHGPRCWLEETFSFYASNRSLGVGLPAPALLGPAGAWGGSSAFGEAGGRALEAMSSHPPQGAEC
jgi:hypothetical protein